MASQKVLWESYEPWTLNQYQTITLSESIEEQKNGILMEWSKYVSPDAVDYDYNYIFIPKFAPKDKRITFLLSSYDAAIGKKSIWVKTGTEIYGVASNGTSQDIGGITYNNTGYAIRRVFGV